MPPNFRFPFAILVRRSSVLLPFQNIQIYSLFHIYIPFLHPFPLSAYHLPLLYFRYHVILFFLTGFQSKISCLIFYSFSIFFFNLTQISLLESSNPQRHCRKSFLRFFLLIISKSMLKSTVGSGCPCLKHFLTINYSNLNRFQTTL